MDDVEKMKNCEKFSKTLLENMQDIDPEINGYVNEHFWEMMGDSEINENK